MSGPEQSSTPAASSAPISTEYGRIPLPAFLAAWNHPDVVRFRYRPIRIVPGLMSIVLVALWAYYLSTVLGDTGFTLPLGIFGAGLLVFTAWVALRLVVWRLFLKRSGVVVTDEALVWRQGPVCSLAPWRLIDPGALGIERVAMEGGYDSFLTIKVGDTAEPLYLVRIYAKLDDIEAFMGELLKRIPREKWEKAGEKAKKGAKKAKKKR